MKKALLVFMILVVFIAGCSGDDDVQTKDGIDSPYIGGNEGLLATFEEMGILNENSKKQEIFENEAFSIIVDLQNKGEHEMAAGDATVAVLGIDLNDFTGIVDGGLLSNTEVIEKVSEFNSEGGQTSLDFTSEGEGAVYQVALTGASYDVNVFARVDYNYKTFVSVPQVCFKEDLSDKTVCDVDEEKNVFSSGAPIQVKKADEKRAGPGKVAVEFSVTNEGDGDVAKPGEDFDARFDELSFTVTGDEWECKGSGGKVGALRLDENGKGKIVCKLKVALVENTLPFTKQLDLTLDYQYREYIQSSVRINKQ